MKCPQCTLIRSYWPNEPWHRTQYNPACIHCGARLIQWLQRKCTSSRADRAERCRSALSMWMAYGHSEDEIRKLAKAKQWAVAPDERKVKA